MAENVEVIRTGVRNVTDDRYWRVRLVASPFDQCDDNELRESAMQMQWILALRFEAVLTIAYICNKRDAKYCPNQLSRPREHKHTRDGHLTTIRDRYS